MRGQGTFANRHGKLIGQLLRFAVSTGFSAAMSFLLPIVLHEFFAVPERIAVAIGFATAYLGNMVLMRVFVFKSRNDWRRDIAAYIVTNGAFRLAEYGAFIALLEYSGLTYVPVLLIVLAASATIKFFAYRWLFAER
ncbi:hypothetical protein GRI38_08030 [Altererythrobacter aurantiacus]|uniref:GtrA/DPMS transmembrane domain-containing protein n=1 Tax=Parapontixanthobacter aurantiacus TaxID=1463599 RepID=A0A844ZBQ9_9SPHN|nr:GtrA family protein [Parapontixanthobacter aurantiacus]MXO85981.1 hypothetical protein [Parapontixanthobacter aurantiacus]